MCQRIGTRAKLPTFFPFVGIFRVTYTEANPSASFALSPPATFRAGSQRSLKGSSLSLIVSSPSQQSQQAGGSSPVFAELACIPMEANSPVLREANQPRAMDQGVSRRYLGFSQVDEDAPEEVVKAAGAEGRAMDAVKAAAVPTVMYS